MLFQPYHSTLTAGQIREYLKDYPDHAEVELAGGDDWADGHSLHVLYPEKVYRPARDHLSRRIGPAFADLAEAAGSPVDRPAGDEYTPAPLPDRLRPPWLLPKAAPLPAGWGTSPRRAPKAARHEPTSASYKPAHGGYPG